MSAKPTALITSLLADAAIALVGRYTFDAADRQYIDTQIRAIQDYLVVGAIKGVQATHYLVNSGSASLVVGDVVCMASSGAECTKAASGAILTPRRALGVCLRSAAPGTYALVCTGGILPAEITGLGAVAGVVRVNGTTGRCERVAAYSSDDFPIGVVLSSGYMAVYPSAPTAEAYRLVGPYDEDNGCSIGDLVMLDPSSGGFTFVLPTAVGVAGRGITFKNVTNSTNAVVLDGLASQTIDGATTYTLNTAYATMTVVSDGANWMAFPPA